MKSKQLATRSLTVPTILRQLSELTDMQSPNFEISRIHLTITGRTDNGEVMQLQHRINAADPGGTDARTMTIALIQCRIEQLNNLLKRAKNYPK